MNNQATLTRRDTLLAATALAALSTLVSEPPANAQQATPSTGGASYTFEHGFPTKNAAQRARDDADFQRAMTAYRFWYPTVSAEGIFNGIREVGIKDNEDMIIQVTEPHHVMFTPNSDTPYGLAVIDVKEEPYVIEVPPGPFIGLADNHHQGWILDMGLPGPAGDKGGKHLIVPPDYKGQVPAGYFTGTSTSFKVIAAFRSLPIGGDVRAATDGLRRLKIYPLSTAADPKPLRIVDVTDKAVDGTCLRWEDNIQYWQKLHEVIDAEPLVPIFLPMYGELAALGIEKGKPFAPDARMKVILENAAKAGRDQLLVSAFDSHRPDRLAWPDRKWEWAGLVPGSAQFETKSGVDLEARDRWFAQAIVTSPAMFRRTVGAGSLYWLGNRDASGAFVEGGKTYKLTVPLPVPGNLFWSVTIYDATTRSEVQTAQKKAALRSLFELKETGNAKSVDLYFGPQAPAGQEGRWIQTTPGKSWFAYFRIYGPQGPAFDGSWKPGDFEEAQVSSGSGTVGRQ
ncbi:DUF1254 domain-containing protein [Bradyrhizobium brasilense]|uniref:DUF1254 domain-containing protein n=1 Tax=Bradyrhizobium brasilense TaxID=1419277 RepID=UPI00287726C0|nr:DUF1254 domain-containing protein [Bradyrhizobium brasilense]MCP3420114.1 DUF1254 domain-containing protein [Bradyrhizobium brasilense]